MCKKLLICLILIVFLRVAKCGAELCELLVTVTAYSHGKKCAWGDKPKPGIIAVSRDLERQGLTYGTVIYIDGLEYVVKDRMAYYKEKCVDIYMLKNAKKFGKKRLKIFWHKKHSGRRRLHTTRRRNGRRRAHK